jgi:hypothetical protein
VNYFIIIFCGIFDRNSYTVHSFHIIFKLQNVFKRNDVLQDESLLKIREEEEKRKEVSAKFQTTLNEITALMQQNNEKNSKLREDNLEITKKFKTVCEQYELREQVCVFFCLFLLHVRFHDSEGTISGPFFFLFLLSKKVFSFVFYF